MALGRGQCPFLVWKGLDLGLYLLWRHTDKGTKEAGRLRVQHQHQLLVLEQQLSIGLRVCLPLWQLNHVTPAQCVPPAGRGGGGDVGKGLGIVGGVGCGYLWELGGVRKELGEGGRCGEGGLGAVGGNQEFLWGLRAIGGSWEVWRVGGGS